jgi:hypothetical protein
VPKAKSVSEGREERSLVRKFGAVRTTKNITLTLVGR